MAHEIQDVEFKNLQDVIDNIVDNNVKGGSPFGRAVAWGIYYALRDEKYENMEEMRSMLKRVSAELVALKPTMAACKNAADLIKDYVATFSDDADVKTVAAKVQRVCMNLVDYSFEAVDDLGAYGANMVKDGDVIMINSYSSSIMSVFGHAADQGKKFTVISTESRPFRESIKGANYLASKGVKVIWIGDPAMHEFVGKANWCITGADTLGFDGSAANKIGTAQLAELAFARGIPFYIASEIFKLKRDTREGDMIPIEVRPAEDFLFGNEFDGLTPEQRANITIINQFFDLTPAQHITGLVTEFGIIPPATVGLYWDKLAEMIIR